MKNLEITTFNIVLTVLIIAVLYVIIPKSYWTLEVMPVEIWVILGVILFVSIGFMISFEEHYPLIVAAFIFVSLATLIFSRVAPEMAQEIGIVGNYRVHWSTYLVLTALGLSSYCSGRFTLSLARSKRPTKHEPDLSGLFK